MTQAPSSARKVVWETRAVEVYRGVVPEREGRPLSRFQSNEVCKVIDPLTNEPCSLRLMVQRVNNTVYQLDRGGVGGGQLVYDQSDFRLYHYCLRHGPFPCGPQTWQADGSPGFKRIVSKE
ncbi:MAG: hypothetical protein ABSB53_05145 [Nitrososphaerales archaeon]|jgi:hypothetical protein